MQWALSSQATLSGSSTSSGPGEGGGQKTYKQWKWPRRCGRIAGPQGSRDSHLVLCRAPFQVGGGLSMSEMVPRWSQDKGQLMLQAGPGGTVGGHTNAPSCLVPKA